MPKISTYPLVTPSVGDSVLGIQDGETVRFDAGSGTGQNSKLHIRNSRVPIPSQLNVRSLMPSAPTPTLGTTQLIASPRYWPAIQDPSLGAPAWTVCCAGAPVRHGAVYPDYLFTRFSNVNYGSTTESNGYKLRMVHVGQKLALSLKGATGAVLCKVKDQYLTLTPQVVPGDGELYFYTVDFGSRDRRTVEFLVHNCPLGGIYTEQADLLLPVPARGPRAIYVGDSGPEGTGSNNIDSMSWQMGEILGWDDFWSSGVGSTGYLAATAPKLKFRDRLATDVYPFNPEVVYIPVSVNDIGQTTAAMVAEATALFTELKANLPNSLIVSGSGWLNQNATNQTAQTIATRNAIRALAASMGVLYVDLLEMPLPADLPVVTGTLTSSPAAYATTFTTSIQCVPENTYAFPDGTRFRVRSVSGLTVTTESGIAAAQVTGTAITRIGGAVLTGTGRVGATTGYGNRDEMVGADNTHAASVLAHGVWGYAHAAGLLAALAPN